MAEYTREFEFLMFKCDIKEPKPQTITRNIRGRKLANNIEK